jgi:hypothetical protein
VPLKTKLKAAVAFELTGTPDFGVTKAEYGGFADYDLKNGTGSDQADRVFADTRTLNPSSNEDLDLADPLLDPIGGAAAFAKVKAIIVRAAATNTNNVVVGGAATNAFVGGFGAAAHTFAVPPGGVFMVSAPKGGWTVTPGTGDLLRIANSGGGTAVTYDITVIGTSA